MHGITQLRAAVKNPKLIFRELNRIYHKRFYTRNFYPRGTDLFSEDWDNLLILDACRYDLFEEESNLPGSFESRFSRGSATNEFLRGNVPGKDLTDVVYVTANPMLENKGLSSNFHDIVNIWKDDGWDEEHKTVLPETVTEYAIKAEKQYPNKRLLVHYLQPHHPFIGTDTSFDKTHPDANVTKFWLKLLTGELSIDKDDIWEAYAENLRIALPHIEEAMTTLEGKTIVTSDHGNMIGETSSPFPLKEWGHPEGVYTDELVKVPWLIHQNSNRKQTSRDPPIQNKSSVDEDVIHDRLSNLGYLAEDDVN